MDHVDTRPDRHDQVNLMSWTTWKKMWLFTTKISWKQVVLFVYILYVTQCMKQVTYFLGEKPALCPAAAPGGPLVSDVTILRPPTIKYLNYLKKIQVGWCGKESAAKKTTITLLWQKFRENKYLTSKTIHYFIYF